MAGSGKRWVLCLLAVLLASGCAEDQVNSDIETKETTQKSDGSRSGAYYASEDDSRVEFLDSNKQLHNEVYAGPGGAGSSFSYSDQQRAYENAQHHASQYQQVNQQRPYIQPIYNPGGLIVDKKIKTRLIPHNEYYWLHRQPGYENIIPCQREGELHSYWTPNRECMVCTCVREWAYLEPVCVSCGQCWNHAPAPAPMPIPIPVTSANILPIYIEPTTELIPDRIPEIVSCSPMPSGIPFQNPLHPCQICVCYESLNVFGVPDVKIECEENPQCVLPPEPIPYIPDKPLPLPKCQKFPNNVVFPHPVEVCKLCKCTVEWTPYGPQDHIICFPDSNCISPIPHIIPEPVTMHPIPPEPIIIPVTEPVFPVTLRPVPRPIPGPLPGPSPHESCRPYLPNQPFQHPWDECQMCVCVEGYIVGKITIEVNCYTKKSCCIEIPFDQTIAPIHYIPTRPKYKNYNPYVPVSYGQAAYGQSTSYDTSEHYDKSLNYDQRTYAQSANGQGVLYGPGGYGSGVNYAQAAYGQSTALDESEHYDKSLNYDQRVYAQSANGQGVLYGPKPYGSGVNYAQAAYGQSTAFDESEHYDKSLNYDQRAYAQSANGQGVLYASKPYGSGVNYAQAAYGQSTALDESEHYDKSLNYDQRVYAQSANGQGVLYGSKPYGSGVNYAQAAYGQSTAFDESEHYDKSLNYDQKTYAQSANGQGVLYGPGGYGSGVNYAQAAYGQSTALDESEHYDKSLNYDQRVYAQSANGQGVLYGPKPYGSGVNYAQAAYGQSTAFDESEHYDKSLNYDQRAYAQSANGQGVLYASKPYGSGVNYAQAAYGQSTSLDESEHYDKSLNYDQRAYAQSANGQGVIYGPGGYGSGVNYAQAAYGQSTALDESEHYDKSLNYDQRAYAQSANGQGVIYGPGGYGSGVNYAQAAYGQSTALDESEHYDKSLSYAQKAYNQGLNYGVYGQSPNNAQLLSVAVGPVKVAVRGRGKSGDPENNEDTEE